MHARAHDIFNRLSDALVVFARDGRVRFANRAAVEAVGVRAGESMPAHPAWAEIARRLDGTLPAELDVAGFAPVPVSGGTLLASIAPSEFVLVLRLRDADTGFENALTTLRTLLDDGASTTLREVRRELDRLTDELGEDTLDAERLARCRRAALASVAALSGRLERVGTLFELSLQGPLASQDRIEVPELARRALRQLDRSGHRSGARIAFDPGAAELGPVYGSEKWLERAFVEVFAHALEATDAGSDVAVKMCQRGAMVVVELAPATSDGPFSRPRASARPPRRPAPPDEREIGLDIVRRVVEAHGGRVLLRQDLDGLIAIVLELPSGAPAQPDEGVSRAQLERYALDLAKLVRAAGVTTASRQEKGHGQDHPRR